MASAAGDADGLMKKADKKCARARAPRRAARTQRKHTRVDATPTPANRNE
jgi:hypothetical protein